MIKTNIMQYNKYNIYYNNKILIYNVIKNELRIYRIVFYKHMHSIHIIFECS